MSETVGKWERRHYCAAVCGVDTVDQVDGEVMFVGCPREDIVAFPFESVDNEVDAAQDRRVWKDLISNQSARPETKDVGRTYNSVTVKVANSES